MEQFGRKLPTGGQDADGDRQVERAGTLGQLGRSHVHDHAVLRPDEARIDHRPLDAMDALLHRRFGKPH
jgi:hypothetical protein